jgi:hypothetical protein
MKPTGVKKQRQNKGGKGREIRNQTKKWGKGK